MMPGLPGPKSAPKDKWSAAGHIRWGLIISVLLVVGMGGWGATAKLAGAVISTGQLRVENQRQVVQHPDGGVVGKIHVQDGDVVSEGDVLIELDGKALASELAVLESQLFEIIARRGRLVAEQTNKEQVVFDAELLDVAKVRPEVQSLIDGQMNMFRARIESMTNEMAVLQEQRAQLKDQIAGSDGQAAALTHQAELIEQELVGQRQLLKQGLAQAARVLSLEREAARLAGERGQMLAQTAQLKGRIAEVEIEMLRLHSKRREEAITEQRELGFRELELKEQRIALREKLSRLDIRAPRPGVIYGMTVHALKSVIRAAEPIVYVVPNDTSLIVDIQLDPIHIDEVLPGQDTTLRFSAFSSRTTPELDGRITRISADAFLEERTGRSFYRAEAVLADGEIEKLKGQKLVAGMPVEVFIQTGERTPLNYLMKPLTDYFNKALREH